jgi:hypothetical protein
MHALLWLRYARARYAAALLIAIALPWIAQAQPATPVITSITPALASLADHLRVTIDNLDGADKSRYDPASFRLRLSDHKFANVEPERRSPTEFYFDLSSLRQDGPGWLALVGSPPFRGVKQVNVSIATSGTDIVGSDKAAFIEFQIFKPWKLVVIGLVGLAILLITLALAVRTTIVRDRGPAPAERIRDIPYSLARCQIAFWFIIILWSFLGIWTVTGDYNDIVSAQSLTLLGISGVTALSAKFVDFAKEPTAAAGVTPPPPPQHTGFWSDLLTDDTGWAFHRFQIVIWTLVLGAVSLWSVRQTLALPTFDNNLLILMGISSGLYIGSKWPEQQTAAPLPT